MSNPRTKREKKNKQLFEDKAQKYFKCTDRERAVFEAGIKLASVYHQFVGTPVSKANVSVLEKAIEEGVRIQPFVKDVKVKIVGESKRIEHKQHEYDYMSLTGNMLNLDLTIKYNKSIVKAKLKYIHEINYPLMYISALE